MQSYSNEACSRCPTCCRPWVEQPVCPVHTSSLFELLWSKIHTGVHIKHSNHCHHALRHEQVLLGLSSCKGHTVPPVRGQKALGVSLPNVEISTIFIALSLLCTFLIVAGIVPYGLFKLKFRSGLLLTPEGKLDWILQSVKDDGLSATTTSAGLRRSISLNGTTRVYGLSPLERKQTEFEAAVYGALN
jgi:hypothetical protein